MSIKWGKEELKDLEIDYSQPPMVFKSQIFSMTGVPIERQKIMVKGGMLKVCDAVFCTESDLMRNLQFHQPAGYRISIPELTKAYLCCTSNHKLP